MKADEGAATSLSIVLAGSGGAGVITAGNVTIERFAVIHTGAKIINKMRVGENAAVGAGAVIIRDVPPNCTVVGVPGRVIGEHEAVELD